MLNGKVNNIFEPEADPMSEQASKIIEASKEFNKGLEERIFIWLKEDYDYVYSMKVLQEADKYQYATKKFYFPSYDKMELSNEINLKDLRDKLIVNGIDYKNKTFEEFKTLMLKLNGGDE